MDMTPFLLQTARKYGPVSKVWLGTRPWVLVSDPDLIRKLAFQSAARPRDTDSYFHTITGENREIDKAGAVQAGGEVWRRARRVFEASLIHSASLAAHMPAIVRCLSRFGGVLERRALSEEPLDVHSALGELSLSMVGEIAYGVDFGKAITDDKSGGADGNDGIVAELAAAVTDMFDTLRPEKASIYLPFQLMFPGAAPAIRWLAHNLPDASQRRAMAGRSKVASVSRVLLEQYRLKGTTDKGFQEVGGGISASSFMAAMVEGRKGAKAEDRLSEIEMIAQSFTFIAAGFETTSSTIAITLFLLATHPEVQQRLIEEVDGLGDCEVSVELLERMPYTEAVLKEAMRLYPAVSILVREMKNDEDLGAGMVVPRGTFIALTTHAVHHDPAVWPEPERFLPERFLPDAGGGAHGPKHPHGYAPFGMGARMCVGHKLAMMIAKSTLLTVFRRFEFRLHPKQVLPLPTKTNLTYGPLGGVWLTVHERS